MSMICMVLRKSRLQRLNVDSFPLVRLEPAIDNNDNPLFLVTGGGVIIDDPRFSANQIVHEGGLYFENVSDPDLIAFRPNKMWGDRIP